MQELKRKCAGRWFSLYEQFGIQVRSDGRHSGCPMCGPGRNKHRFRVSDLGGDGTWICTQCGAGDGIALIQKVLGLDFKETIERIEEIVGGCKKMDKTQDIQIDKTDTKALLNKIWSESAPLSGSDPVSKYLHTRKLVLQPDNVRYCPHCYESDTQKHYPAMIAKVMNSRGLPVALHRTYLDFDKPMKADIESPKKLTPGLESLTGCAIRLFEPKDNTVGIAEGIETAIACTQLFDIPTWACISNTIMEGFEPPEGIRRIVIFGDADVNYTGQKSAYVLANKLYNKDYLVEVRIPTGIGTDFNDNLLSE